MEPLRYFAWIRGLPDPDARRHDLLASGVEPLDAAELARRAGPLGAEAFADLAFASRARVEAALGELLDLPAEQVFRQSAGTGALFTACLAFVRPGDLVLVETPTYEPLWAVPQRLGAEVAFFERSYGDGRLTRAELPPARLVLATHPHNPTGHRLHREDIESLVDYARTCDARVVVDAAYLLFLEDDGLPRPLPPELLVVGSLTKTLGLSSLRLGFLAHGDPALRERLQSTYDLTEVYPPTAASELAMRLATDGSLLARGRAHATAVRALWDRMAPSLPDRFTLSIPEGGIFALLALPLGVDDVEFAGFAAERHDVWVTPGSLFRAPGMVRIGCGHPVERVEPALEALLEACHAYVSRAAGAG